MVKGVKAFEKGLVCRDFQFEENKEFTVPGTPETCANGFHFCENPLDVLEYYPLIDSNGNLSDFAEVEAIGDIDRHENKIATNHIRIGAKLSLPGFIKASFDFLWNKITSDPTVPDSGHRAKLASSGHRAQLASSGDYSKLASSGHRAQLASSGHRAQLASSGDSAQLASSGHRAQLASSGDSAQLASSGDSAQLASSGDSAQLASSGDRAQLASSGDSAQLASSGDSAQLASSGDYSKLASSGHRAQLASSGDSAQLALEGTDSVGAAIGIDNRIKGALGCWITLAEWKFDYDKRRYEPVCVRSAKVDGEVLKADTWYELHNGEFVEASVDG